ncbi:MAG: hypothetical protein ACRERX_04680 [Pseudomonas sp.]
MPLVAGLQTLNLNHTASGKRQGQGLVALKGAQNGVNLDMSPTFLRFGGEGMDVGIDRKRKVSVAYADRGVFAYPGQISHVCVRPGAQAPGSMTNRPEALAQLD